MHLQGAFAIWCKWRGELLQHRPELHVNVARCTKYVKLGQGKKMRLASDFLLHLREINRLSRNDQKLVAATLAANGPICSK
jgi:hypothetical protein